MYKLNKKKFGTHQIVSRIINDSHLRILDVGCNEGYLKNISSSDNKFWGIDFDLKALEIAKKNGYQDTYLMDLNYYPYKKAIKTKFDAILFIDLLEHLLDPIYTLNFFCQNNLEKGGIVIVSLPNVANISVRLKLLFGSFNYTEAGILDKSHLHLYTKRTAEQLILILGLKIIEKHFSSNLFGPLIKTFPFLASLLGYNLIYVCIKK